MVIEEMIKCLSVGYRQGFGGKTAVVQEEDALISVAVDPEEFTKMKAALAAWEEVKE